MFLPPSPFRPKKLAKEQKNISTQAHKQSRAHFLEWSFASRDASSLTFGDEKTACRHFCFAAFAIKEQSNCDLYFSHFPHPVNS